MTPWNSTVCESPDVSLRISPKNFGRLAGFVTSELGIQMPESKVSLIQSRLARRVRELGLGSLDDYCDHFFACGAGGNERIRFIDAVTTNKTDFFREPQHFRYLTDSALPQLTRAGEGSRRRDLSVWSAACSSGEEPYTLAMVLSEYAAAHPPFQYRILATDISTRVLETARDGIYQRQTVSAVPAALRQRYLLQSRRGDPSVRIRPALRQSVSFHRLNLMDGEYAVREMFDIIFCRNVLIYFDRPTQQAVIGKLCRHLRPGGYLFISLSETLSGLDLPLISLGASCFQKKDTIA